MTCTETTRSHSAVTSIAAKLHSGLRTPHSQTAPLWIVSELYYPEETSTGRILTQIAEGLQQSNEIQVVCGQPTYSQRGCKSPWQEVRQGVQIHRCWGTTFNKDRLLLRLLNALTLGVSIFVRLLFSLRARDHVLVVTTPPSLPFIAYLACRIRRARCSLLIHDVYPDFVVAAGILKPTSLPTRFLNGLMSGLLRAADSLIVLGRDMASLIRSKLPTAQHSKITVIPNWSEAETIHPLRRSSNGLLARLNLQDKFVVQYSGNMGRAHNIEDLVCCAQELADCKTIHFLLIGSGAKKKWLHSAVAEKRLANVTLLDHVPRNQLEDSLNACDVTVISFVSGMAGISVPCRMYNVLAAGKPIVAIADPHSELALMVQEERVGWVVAPADVTGLAALISDLPYRRVEIEEMGRRARRVAEEKYRYELILDQYCEWLASQRVEPRQLPRAA